MLSSSLPRRRPAAAAVLGGATLLLLARPLRGQQPQAVSPTAALTAPATASPGANTRVSLSYAAPAGLALTRNPSVVVLDPTGQLFELWPVHLAAASPSTSGFIDLHTELYPPGTYDLHVQVDYRQPDGTAATYSSPHWSMTVPAR